MQRIFPSQNFKLLDSSSFSYWAGMPNDGVWCQIFDECLKPDSPYGGNCAAWVIINKNMDYLRCPDKLGWKKASSCE